MKKITYVILFVLLFIPSVVLGKEVNMYLFYGDGCPHCAALEEYLDGYLEENKDVKLYKYEVWYHEENQDKYNGVKDIIKDNTSGIPYLIIGNTSITGYADESTNEQIVNTVNYYRNTTYKDSVGIYLGEVEEKTVIENDNKQDTTIENINGPKNIKNIVKNSPLIISTIVIGLVDGFNPCAMWILIFLISMLLGIENKRRKWTLGIIFLISSAIVYFLFLISWLNLSMFLNKIVYIRLAIAVAAILFGCYSVLKQINRKSEDGCEVVDSKNRKRIITSIKKIVKEKSFVLAILGIILLACAVNIIELLCSLGLPVMFTQILTLNNISNSGKIIYSLIYVLFFLIDDVLVFIFSMKTLEIKAISNKFGRYSHLIGGIIMIIIGFLMIYKPEWLMFNF